MIVRSTCPAAAMTSAPSKFLKTATSPASRLSPGCPDSGGDQRPEIVLDLPRDILSPSSSAAMLTPNTRRRSQLPSSAILRQYMRPEFPRNLSVVQAFPSAITGGCAIRLRFRILRILFFFMV